MSNADDDFAVSDYFDLFCKENKFMSNSATSDNEKQNGGNDVNSELVTTARNIGSSAGAAVAKASDLAQTAQEYGHKISGAACQAKDFVDEQVSVISDKIKELGDVDLGELGEKAKEYARRKPGQAILISLAAGLLLGLILRSRR